MPSPPPRIAQLPSLYASIDSSLRTALQVQDLRARKADAALRTCIVLDTTLELPTIPRMGLIALVYSIGVFWALVHFIHRLTLHSSGKRPSGILPSVANARAPRRRWLDPWGVRVTLQPVYVRLETTGFNDFHDACITYLVKKSDRFTRKAMTMFYDVGSVAGVFGMALAIGLLFVTTYRLLLSLLHRQATILPPQSSMALGKRDMSFENVALDSSQGGTGTPLQIIVSSYMHRASDINSSRTVSWINRTAVASSYSTILAILQSGHPRTGSCYHRCTVSTWP